MRYYRNNDIYSIYENAQMRIQKAEMQTFREFSGIVLENGNLIKNCDIFITSDLVESCFGDRDLVRQSILTEASRVDVGLLNFLKDGNDYKTLKRDLRELIDLNNDAEKKPSAMKKGLRTCKRVIQAIHDYEIVSPSIAIAGITAAGTALLKTMIADINATKLMSAAEKAAETKFFTAFISVPTLILIASLIYGYIYNFVLRYTEDYDDYKEIKSELDDNLKELKKNARNCEDNKMKKKYEDIIDKIESRIEKIEKNRDGVTRKAAGKWIDDRTITTAIDTKSHQVNRRKEYND